MDHDRHTDRVAVVTGAGSGIGRATASRLLDEGATVIGLDRSDEGFAGWEHPRLDLRMVDVTDPAAVSGLTLERVDILVNNAGVMDHFVPVGELDDELWDAVIGINLTAVMRLSRLVVPIMQDQGSGAIVTVGSKGSLSGGVSGAAYTASKHGVIGLAQHIAWFYGPAGIRSNVVCPGAVATAIGASAMPRSDWALARAQTAMATMGSIAAPEDIAAAISWLASDEARTVNGAVVTVDGGWSAA
ncbi:MAG: SDR family oxidoreductase [Candidatus Nanopelagicales bacterium]